MFTIFSFQRREKKLDNDTIYVKKIVGTHLNITHYLKVFYFHVTQLVVLL